MKRFVLLVSLVMLFLSGWAQEGYRVNGKLTGVSDGKLLLISSVGSVVDTLQSTLVINGVFEFVGQVEQPVAAYIKTADGDGIIPLMLENADFSVSMKNGSVMIKGGPLQEIYNRFLAMNSSILLQREKIQQEIQAVQREKDETRMRALVDAFNKTLEDAKWQEKELLVKYADTYVAAYVVASGMEQLELDTLRERYNLLSDVAKATAPGRSVAACIEAMEKVSVGNVAPDFTVVTEDVGVVILRELKGMAKIIHFWASWNAASREENVELLKLYQQYRMKGLRIVSISLDTNMVAWKKAINMDGMVWDHGFDLLDGESQVACHYFVHSVPRLFLLDENNTIIAMDLHGRALRQKVAEMLKVK